MGRRLAEVVAEAAAVPTGELELRAAALTDTGRERTHTHSIRQTRAT